METPEIVTHDEHPGLHIIHAEKDKQLASEIRRFIANRGQGIKTTLSSAPSTEIAIKPLAESNLILCLCSKAASDSESVKSEIEDAVKLGKRIISAELEWGFIPEQLIEGEVLDFTMLYKVSDLDYLKPSARELNLEWALGPVISAAQFNSKRTSVRDFSYLWNNLNLPDQIISALIPVGLIFLFVLLTPPTVATFIHQDGNSESYRIRASFLVPEQKLVPLEGELELKVPKVIKISETQAVAAELTLEGQAVGWVPTAKLDSPSFSITPTGSCTASASDKTFVWGWLIRPKQLGQHAVSLQIDDARAFMPSDEIQRRDLSINGSSLIAVIRVVNDLGITSEEETFLKAVGAILGLLGTVLAYPLWKFFFGRKVIRARRRGSGRAARQNKHDRQRR